ncbi:hypothetical protein GOV07_04205 [Candidatus Woesearchaeota archaeon]|nr:hypothetical protein [Candidatus Woesearchaeota archaeon]
MGCVGRLGALFLLLLVFTPVTLAVGIGVNKGSISYEDVLQNGYAQEVILVTTDSPETIIGTYQFEGGIAPWLRVEPPVDEFEFSRGNPYALTLIVEPPRDARLEDYDGGFRVLTGEILRSDGGKIGTSTRAAFFIKIALGVSGTERLECSMGGVRIKDTELEQPFDFMANVVNKGNVRIQPEFKISIYDQFQEKLVAELAVPMDEEIFPTVTSNFVTQVTYDLSPGQYWATVELPLCGDSTFLTFDVLDRGGVADKGELLRVEAQSWAETGDIIPIKAIFLNKGSRIVSAKFKGTITTRNGGRLVKVIDTDLYNVPPGETAEIETFFNPVDPAQYIVAGRVLYNNKLTFQKGTVINVEGMKLLAAASFGGPFLLILFLLIAILVFLILIARKKRRRRHAYR